MSKKTMKRPPEFSDFEEVKRKMVEPDWVREARAHYEKTGFFRPEDLFRLLGDPARGISPGSRGSIAGHFCGKA